MIGVNGGIDFLQFSFGTAGAIDGSVPSVTYAALRAGVDARIPFWRMALLLDFGYDGALSAGAVHDRFRDSTVGGIDLGVGLGLALGPGSELRLQSHYTRYFYKFHPKLGDAYVAGGALDEFLGFRTGRGLCVLIGLRCFSWDSASSWASAAVRIARQQGRLPRRRLHLGGQHRRSRRLR